ncbi:MAG TPA: DUF2784 domain-containing protein [Symbiobacteriaceae bacterium]|nr:DUF2784 domain-containing protein [Symbiobacteriaceae bacterium]
MSVSERTRPGRQPEAGRLPGRVYGLLADATLVAHFLFVLLAVAGGFLLLLRPGLLWLHVPVVVWSSLVNLFSWTCPLTPIENRFRRLSGAGAYNGGFVQHYVGGVVYPKGMPRQLELVAGTAIVAWNALVYCGVFLLAR